MEHLIVVLAYLLSIILASGGLFCLYVSLRMVGKRAAAAGTKTSFTGEISGHTFSIGTGSLAALVMCISVLWGAIAVLSKPRIEFHQSSGPNGVIKSIASAVPRPLGSAELEATALRAAEIAAANAGNAYFGAAAEATVNASTNSDWAAAEASAAADDASGSTAVDAAASVGDTADN